MHLNTLIEMRLRAYKAIQIHYSMLQNAYEARLEPRTSVGIRNLITGFIIALQNQRKFKRAYAFVAFAHIGYRMIITEGKSMMTKLIACCKNQRIIISIIRAYKKFVVTCYAVFTHINIEHRATH